MIWQYYIMNDDHNHGDLNIESYSKSVSESNEDNIMLKNFIIFHMKLKKIF